LKNKKKTYVLLFLVVSVWGMISYKVITGLHPDLPELTSQQTLAVQKFKLDTKIDTFSISSVERDPFLGTILKKKSPSTLPKKRKTILWHPITYLGIVKNSRQKQQVFIVSINGKQCLLKRGQTRDSTTLVSGNKNRITLRYKNHQKVFARKK